MRFLILFSIWVALGTLPAAAQTAPADHPAAAVVAPPAPAPVAVITANGSVAVGKNLIFSAADTQNLPPEPPAVYRWDFGDGGRASGAEVAHVFKKPGDYTVKLTVQAGEQKAESATTVFVFEKAVLLLTDTNADPATVAALTAAARNENTLLATVISETRGALTDEAAVATALAAAAPTPPLAEMQAVVVWTRGAAGLNGLVRYLQDSEQNLAGRPLVIISTESLRDLARIARGAFATLAASQVIVTRPDGLRTTLHTPPAQLSAKLTQEAVPQEVVSAAAKFSWTAPLTFLVDYLVSRGIPSSTILLVLLLPVIATLVAFLKQVVGITTFGVYLPSVVTLSLLVMGLPLGLTGLAFVLLGSVATRRLLAGHRLAYTPRMALVLTAVGLVMLGLIAALVAWRPFGNSAEVIAASIFPLLIMSTLAEKFVSLQTEQGTYSAVRLTAEVVGVAVVCYLVVGQWEYLRTFILAHAELVLLFLVANFALGRFTGLRVTEYFRFREVLEHAEE